MNLCFNNRKVNSMSMSKASINSCQEVLPATKVFWFLCAILGMCIIVIRAEAVNYGAYDPTQADQFRPPHSPDIVPEDSHWREADAYTVGMSAVIYAYPAVMQYIQMVRQVTDKTDPEYAPFNTFSHGREMAGPEYKTFKAPNVDTLYSNAWLDLTKGPLVMNVPETGGRYYTTNFLDMYSNATNIGQRTHGDKGGKYLIATTQWQGQIPEGLTLFRVTTPYMWVLLRILIDNPSEYSQVHVRQDKFTFTPLEQYLNPKRTVAYDTQKLISAKMDGAMDFFRTADFVIRENGFPITDLGHVSRFQRIGIGGQELFDANLLSVETKSGLERAYCDVMAMLETTGKQKRSKMANNWRVGDVGMYGSNYLLRATVNSLGLGANVIEENHAFVSFIDKEGVPLAGTNIYCIHFSAGKFPPVNAFWSLTLYRWPENTVYANVLNRYALGDRSQGMQYNEDGSLDIYVQHDKPTGLSDNWIPAPEGKFWLVLRCYLPKQEMMDGGWQPPYIEHITEEP
jgi:hypothetical protein